MVRCNGNGTLGITVLEGVDKPSSGPTKSVLSRTKSERVKAQLGVHYMREIGHDLVNNSDLPFGFLRNLQNHNNQLDEYGYARDDQVLDDLEDEVSNESIWDQILREQEPHYICSM